MSTVGLLVNLADRTHEVEPGKEGARLKAGDIIAVQAWDTANPDLEVNGVITLPTPLDQGWLVVSDVPDAWDIDRITNAFVEAGEYDETGNPVGKRKWRINYPAGAWATFVAQRWYRATFAQVKSKVVRVKTGDNISDDDFLRARLR